MINIVTVEREFGAGSAGIAAKLASQLNWQLWDQNFSAEIARRARVDLAAVRRCEERVDPPLARLVKVFMRGSFEHHIDLKETQLFDADCMVVLMQEIIDAIAASGNCVLVGRGAPYFLRNCPTAFHVFVYASREEKLRRLATMGHSREDAEHLIDTIDKERMAFAKKYFRKDWPCRQLYHVMVNSGVGDDAVINLIVDHMRRLEISKDLARSSKA
jgi:cytidylate kinase